MTLYTAHKTREAALHQYTVRQVEPPNAMSLYRVLGLGAAASKDEVRAAYKRQALVSKQITTNTET